MTNYCTVLYRNWTGKGKGGLSNTLVLAWSDYGTQERTAVLCRSPPIHVPRGGAVGGGSTECCDALR